MGSCRRSYIFLLVQKFRTSEIWDKWSPASKLVDIKLSHYPDGRYIIFTCTRTHLSAIANKSVFFISSNLFPCLLWLSFEYWITYQLCRFRCKSATVYILHNFSNVLAGCISSDFTWLSFCGVFYRCVFFMA